MRTSAYLQTCEVAKRVMQKNRENLFIDDGNNNAFLTND